ncbi:YtxH domain-containing protein [Clostridium butyricum]|uniref:YtxH domain-containing protein n=1 Tax=Clostridium butyricum TaxID=1492 RepID=UPI0022E84C02|nr:YtxH domain-containing protein [Clostridium butyricum]
MALDLIKQYLVGIGFNVDESSLQNAESAINDAGSTLDKFAKNSSEGFSEAGSSLKDLFKLFGDTNGAIGKLFPNLRGPFKGIIKDIGTITKLYSNLKSHMREANNLQTESNSNNTEKRNSNTNHNSKEIISNTNFFRETNENINNTGDRVNNLRNIFNMFSSESNNGITSLVKSLGGLKTTGGGAITGFTTATIASFALIITATIAVIKAISKVTSYLNDLANQDIGYEKLSRQLWTTKENAKEIDMSLKTLGASMQDLWLSPTLLKQFNQLRQDSKDLKLPPEFNKNFKIVQDISFEFKRFKQMLSMFFQWIGNYILKYCAGPLNEIKNSARGFNDWLKDSIPGIAKAIGTVIGVLLRIILIIGKIIAVVIKLTTPIFYVFKLIGKLGDLFDKLPEPIKRAIKIIISTILMILSPILLVIGVIDDLMTYFRGGKSVIGSALDKIKGKCKNAGFIIKGIITAIKAILTGGLSLLPWDKYWDKAKETFEKIKDKAKETWDKVKGWASNKVDDAKEFISNAGDKVRSFVSGEDKSSVSESYVTSNNSNVSNSTTETKNSHNTVSNSNVINVYGGNDSKSTANAVNKNITGITNRSLQGVY